ncbi:uncharacterized protein ARMOST_13623 [Armillaria ostoyae]|uniref:Uncharacterized protein n=1 Tax=Armillaria ostoyae TaxID=47428 RepID=A0A284RN96_ARMOS|nr:uncharacterized protein ARMOST_13623 [Armillaria ostoyae]
MQDKSSSLAWAEQEVHSRGTPSATIALEFGPFQQAPDGPEFVYPNSGDTSTWTTLGVWFAQTTGYQDNFGGRKWGKAWEEHRATTLFIMDNIKKHESLTCILLSSFRMS